MPYKHIAAHLKKTELACRLHYHQLSHGSNRRKRTTSMSSGSSTSGHSPIMQTSIPSPIHEHGGPTSRSASPPESYGSASPGGIQLPSIMSATASTNTSPRLPTILPKPNSMSLALASMGAPNSGGTSSPTASRGYPTPLHEVQPHNNNPLPSATSFRGSATPTAVSHPLPSRPAHPPHHHTPLRLDCSALPPPPSSASTPGGMPAPPYMASHPVDMSRLTAVYNAHRASFWAAVAADYGPGANPLVLEQAWRGTTGPASGSINAMGAGANMGNLGIAAQTPITPIGSPDDHVYGVSGAGSNGNGGVQSKPDKTRISAILGIDANPRSPSEREIVRRMEEERCGSVGMVGA